MTSNLFGDDVSVLLGTGAGGLGAPTHFATGAEGTAVLIGDLNGDGNPDLATPTSNHGIPKVFVLLGDGSGGFGTPTGFATGPHPSGIAAGDLNEDGQPDLAVSHESGVSVLDGNGAGGFQQAASLLDSDGYSSVAVGDVDDDGKPDLVTASRSGNLVAVRLNTTTHRDVLFVAEGGSDSGTCLSQASPCATVSYALTQADVNATINVAGTIHDHVSITFGVTISGANAPADSPAVLDGSSNGRVVSANASGPVRLDHLRIEHGSASDGGGVRATNGPLTLAHTTVAANTASGSGGGIWHANDLTLTDSTVSGNTAPNFTGGGLQTIRGNLVLIDSTVSGNFAAQSGGGIDSDAGSAGYAGSVTLTGSTVSGNTAAKGGGIAGYVVTATVSTVSGNSASYGGGIWIGADGDVRLIASTVAGNSGGGIENQLGTVRLGATIVAGNTGPYGNCSTSGPGPSPYISLGFNLTNDAGGAACGLTQATDKVGANPGLGTLGDNGGPTETMVPAGSAALNVVPLGTVLNGVQVCPGVDQRGFARPLPSSSSCAVGAVEPDPPAVSSFTPASGITGSAVTITGTNFSGASGVKFGSLAASFSVQSATQITATVPNGAVAGKISVTTARGTGTSAANFTPTLSITGQSPVQRSVRDGRDDQRRRLHQHLEP